MPLTSIPAIDANICSGWTEQQVDLYNKLPFYLAKMQVDYRSTWATWKKFLGTKKWQRNMGDTMKAVTKEPSPHLRQFFTPALLSQSPRKDVIDIRERTATAQVRKHRIESLTLNFVPDFQDFLTDHVDAAGADILEKQTRLEDLFYRSQIFYQSPKVRVAGDATDFFVGAPMETATETTASGVTTLTGANAKTSAWNQAMVARLGAEGNLGMLEMNRIMTAAQNDERILPYTGSDIPKQDQGISGKYCFVLSTETWDALTFDPYLQQNKNCNLDVVNGRFQGSLFGRATCILEDKSMQMAENCTFNAPETRVVDPAAYNVGESVPNPAYTSLDDAAGSPYVWSYLVGAQGYDAIDIGPPPSAFASNGMPKGFGKMFWNGEIMLTKNFMIPCPTDDDADAQELNTYGEYIKFISQTVYGILGKQRRNIIPILHKRKRGN